MNSTQTIKQLAIHNSFEPIHKFCKWALTIVCLFALINTFSQQKLYQFKHITSNDGLSNSQLMCILQDSKGFMWIGTYNGLNRYDGTKFVVYKNIPSDSTSIQGNVAKDIFEDHNHNLFIGTFEGLSLYDRNLDRFLNFKFEKKSALFGLGMSIFKITEDSDFRLWLASSDGLFCFDYYNNKLTQFRHDPNNSASISDNFIESTYIDKKGRLWISTHKGLDLMDVKTGKIEHVTICKTHNENIDDIYQSTAIEDNGGNIWFGSNDGLFCLENNQNNNKIELVHYINNPKDNNSLSHNYITALYVDEDNNLFIGTYNGGINIFNRQKRTFSHIRIDDFNPQSLNNESIFAITEDRNKNIWVGTFGGGINISINNSDFILNYKNLPGAPLSLGHNLVKRFFEDKNGRKWIATMGGGLNLFDEKTAHFVRYNTTNSNISSDVVLCIEQVNNNQLWIGTWAGGLENLNLQTNKFNSFTTKNSSISDDNIHCIAKDKEDNLWLGSEKGGLIKYNVKENKFKSYLPENSKICSKRIFVVKLDNKGNLYLGATIKLQIFNPTENRFDSYSFNPNDSNSISNNSIIDILIQNDTCVWIATGFGLNSFNPLTKKFKRYFKKDGLPDNIIYGLALDKSEILWVTTNYGLCRFDYKNNKFKNFSNSDGLQGNEFTENSILTSSNGNIFVGGNNGFNIINPLKVPENKLQPEVLITDFHIFNQPAAIGAKGSPLTKQISESKEIILEYDQSVITLFFAVLDFTNPQKNQCAYMMENFDKRWTFCGNRKEATYTNLNPGEYTFRVKGANNDGIWNEKGTSITIIIRPPYWQTIWFKALFLAIIAISIYVFIKIRIQREKKIAKLLKVKVKQRTIELEEAATILEENQEEIQLQKEELRAQRDSLGIANTYLLEKQNLIIIQNEELDKHRNSLEKLVEERTLELEKALYRAEESNRLKSSFLANMSHEIRTPMNAIVGFTSLLPDENLSKEERNSMIDIIAKNCNSLLVLINDILDLSSIQANQMVLVNKNIDLIDLLKDIFKTFSGEAQSRNLLLKLNISQFPEKYIVNADFVRVRQVITNLITNALKFTCNGTIELGIKEIDSQITIYVKDSGIGIPSHFGNSIFDRFTKIEENNDILYGGTGLGLSISKSLVELWNGNIWYESIENEGSVFYFTIPNAIASKEISKNTGKTIVHQHYPNLQNKTILIAEDQETNYKLLNAYLIKTKANIIWARNGQEAISIINSSSVDLILMDIKMPLKNGIETTKEIRSKNPNIIIIAQTAYAFEDEIKRFLDSGMNGYLTKPIRENDLIQMLIEKLQLYDN